MIGRAADLFRLAWGLLYWNARKSWFRYRAGRSPCPCQSPSDSGRPFETGCEACVHWHRPVHFRRVCPLLVETPEGLRCSVDTVDVRPFWGRAAFVYGGTLLSLYLAAALMAFAVLRTVGYPISIVHLVWPPSWHKVGHVRGWFFMDRSQRAFAAGRPAEGMLYLRNAYEFDPTNPTVALVFAQKLQLNHPAQSDEVFRRLLREAVEQRALVSQLWFRALLARGDFGQIRELAGTRVLEEPVNGSVWMRALVLASRALGETDSLERVRQTRHLAARPWDTLIDTELALRAGRVEEARRQLRQSWRDAPGYARFYQIDALISLGEGVAAADLAQAYGGQLDDTARAALLLRAYAHMGLGQSLLRTAESLLSGPLNPPTLNLLCAHLIRSPNPAVFAALYRRFEQTKPPVSDEYLQSYVALYCAAGAAGDWDALHALGARLQPRSGNAFTLSFVEAFFRGQTPQTRATSMLPALPLPLEVTYALLERYPGPKAVPAETGK